MSFSKTKKTNPTEIKMGLLQILGRLRVLNKVEANASYAWLFKGIR